MADAYWRYSDLRQPPQQQLQQQQPPPPQQQQIQQPPTIVGKRPRSDYDIPSGHQPPNYYAREDDRGPLRSVRDTDSIEASYERYLRGAPVPPYNGGQSARPISGVPSRPADDPRIEGMGGLEPGPAGKDRSLGSGRPEISLPPDASSTLFVEGLPSDCSRREVARILHWFPCATLQLLFLFLSRFISFVPQLSEIIIDIFRPFVGYKEVRLVSKESRRPGGDPLVLCFVDFLSPAHSATAMDALHGYRFDEHDRDSSHLRLQFARFPGARSGGGHRGKR